MPVAEAKAAINAAPERVWDMVTALPFWRLWMSDVANVRSISTPVVTAGTTFEVTLRGKKTPVPWRVAAWQPPEKVQFTALDGNRSYTFTLEPEPSGTLLTIQREVVRHGFGRLLPAGAQERAVRASLATLRDLIAFNRDIALLHGIGDE